MGLLGCAESMAPTQDQTIRLGVDKAYQETGLAAALRAGFEVEAKLRLELVFADADQLQADLRASKLEAVMTSASEWTRSMQIEGLLVNSMSIAHEELVFIGPAEDKFRSHGATNSVEFLRNVIRSNHLYLMAAKNSFESEGHARLARKNGDRPGAGALIQVPLSGVPFFKEVVRRRAFGLVRRSALVLATNDGVKAHRVYQAGQPELVLAVDFLFLHSSKASRPGAVKMRRFLESKKAEHLINRVGLGRVGLPFYVLGLPKSGLGASVPESPSKPTSVP